MDSLRDALDRLLADYPGIIEQAAKFVYLADSDDTRDDWSEQSNEFRELYRSEVRLVLRCVRDAIPERLPDRLARLVHEDREVLKRLAA